MPTRRTVLTTLFLTVCLASFALLAYSSYNYIEFFIALEKFTLKLRDVKVTVGSTNATLNATFELNNPTDYAGFSLRELSYNLELEANNHTVELSYDTVFYAQDPIAISAQWRKTFELGTYLDAERPATSPRFESLSQLYQANQGKNITWTLKMTVILLNRPITQIDILLTSSLISTF